MKTCFICGNKKETIYFYKHKGMADGYLNKCKACTGLGTKQNRIDNRRFSDKKENGVISTIYSTQKQNQKKRGHGEVPYSKDELKNWMYNNGFECLYKNWAKSGYKRDLKPSVDRLNDFEGYSINNIQLITWHENKLKQHKDITNGTGTSGKACKPVYKLSSDKKTICEYVSYRSAVRDIGYSIEHQLKNGVKCRQGFYWVYK
mgnify:CR=1 FL=1|jgi:hypothetical protein